MSELYIGAMWAAQAARVVLVAYWPVQATKLATAMRKLLQSLIPARAMPLALCLSALALSLTANSEARSLSPPSGAGSAGIELRIKAEAHDGISLDEAVSRAERQYRARVVRTDVQDEDGRKIYVLKLLSEDGRVFTVRIDAATGGMR